VKRAARFVAPPFALLVALVARPAPLAASEGALYPWRGTTVDVVVQESFTKRFGDAGVARARDALHAWPLRPAGRVVRGGMYNGTTCRFSGSRDVGVRVFFAPVEAFGGGSGELATSCLFAPRGVMLGVHIVVDSDRRWYTGTGVPPDGSYDLWSVLTHELGHAFGRSGHQEGCPSELDPHYPTMCTKYSTRDTKWRDTELLDRLPMTRMYAPK
jgi:hypothetical protein